MINKQDDIIPFIRYCEEDLDAIGYPKASDTINPRTKEHYFDPDGDFLVGDSGGFLMNMNFIFIKTEKFRELAIYYDKHGEYCPHKKGTLAYNSFWSRETKRRSKGLTANCKLLKTDIKKYLNAKSKKEADSYLKPLRITGDHYHYLNYGRIERTLNEKEKEEYLRSGKKSKTKWGFPRFWDGDYWNFKSDEFAFNNGFNLCKGKARRKGYSFKRGNQAANTLNLNPGITIVLAAYDDKYLTKDGGTSVMLKNSLDWLETETYYRRFLVSENLKDLYLGHKTKKGGNKIFGWKSRGISVSCGKNSSAAAGKGALEVDFEEAGIFPNLQEAYDITSSTVEAGALSRGIMRVYGTAGTKDANWQAFANMFYNPRSNKMMPFENIWDNNARGNTCGFFHPQIWNYEPHIDEYGNSKLREAYAADLEDKREAEKNKSLSDYLVYVGQRANSPEEAFKRGSENIFTTPELSNHASQVEFNPDLHAWTDGMVIKDSIGQVKFKSNKVLKFEGITTHDYITDVPFDPKKDPHGCIRMYYPPYRGVRGNVPEELYYICYDTVDKDKDKKFLDIKNSLNSIHVLMYPNNISNSPGDILIASYVGRPNTMEEADRIALYLSILYNAKIIVETNAGETVANFKRWGELHRLYRDPTSIIDGKARENMNAPYGMVIGNTGKAEDGIRYIRDWLYTKVGMDEDSNFKYNLHYIRDLGILKELLNYTKDGNFDRLSALRVGMFQRMAYRAKNKEPQDTNKSDSIFSEIGLYGFNNN